MVGRESRDHATWDEFLLGHVHSEKDYSMHVGHLQWLGLFGAVFLCLVDSFDTECLGLCYGLVGEHVEVGDPH